MLHRLLIAIIVAASGAITFAQQAPPLVPTNVQASKTVRTAVNDRLLTEAERTQLRIFHGLLDEVPASARQSAAFALARFDLNHPSLQSDDAPALLRAEAAWHRGDLHQVLTLLAGDDRPQARYLKGRSLALMGRYDEAIAELTPLRAFARDGAFASAAEAVAAGLAVAKLAELEGRPASDFHFVMDLLGTAQQQLDRLHWPAVLAQARLMIDKDNPEEAVAALHQVLQLNPNCSEAWFLLGRVALMGFNFDAANQAAARLRQINPQHLLADVLETESYLTQKDADAAQRVLVPALFRYPNHRHLLACSAAVAALNFDEPLTQAAVEQFDSVSPGHPLAHYLAGKYLSAGRQYEESEAMLKQAIARMPNWTKPQIELGLLLTQSGKEDMALAVLRNVNLLDPFNKRALNTLKMLEELAGYKTLETEHFVIKYRDEIDGALAADMPEELERIYDDITGVFGHEPRTKTLIEIMPDKRWFAIRITGMPWIWTIGACTGPVIAITPPREGKHHSGPFDWPRVLRHEFVHTVTLDQTGNRIAHWFTEACAVSQEPEPRDYATAQLLAEALLNDELFDLTEINWAFVRPKRENDRALAYAQAHWMYEYISEKYGHDTILKMLELCRAGVPESRLIVQATGESADAFLSAFKEWALGQVQTWGLNPSPAKEKLLKQIAHAGAKADAKLDELLGAYPEHPDLLRLAAERAVQGDGSDEEKLAILTRYAAARPIDTWTDRQLATVLINLNQLEAAAEHLETLDRFDQTNGDHATALLKLYRSLGTLDKAQRAAARALARRPYDASLREAAATVALQRKEADTALHHLNALTLIESDRSIHFVRLAALLTRMGKTGEARSAAEQARKLNPEAPVDAYLKN